MTKRQLMSQSNDKGLTKLYHFSTKLLPLQTNEDGAQARVETVNDRDWLVLPVIAVLETVLNGMLLPAEEIARLPEAWEGMPVPIGHPQVDGWYVSARTRDQLPLCAGWFFDVHSVGDRARLVGDIWLDMAKAYELGGNAERAVSQLRNGHSAEVSTAFYADIEPITGSYNGVEYFGIFRNIVPDHLAVLLDQEGACNWQDGCGCPRANEQESDQQADSLPDSNIETHTREENTDMDRQAMIDALVACQCCELSAEQLAELDDSTLAAMSTMTANFQAVLAANSEPAEGEPEPEDEAPEGEAEDVEPEAEDVEPEPEPEATVEAQALREIVNEFGSVKAFAEALQTVKTNANAERDTLVSTVLNANAGFDKAELEAMSVETLRKLAESVTGGDFSGRALPNANRDNGQAEELPMPTMAWS